MHVLVILASFPTIRPIGELIQNTIISVDSPIAQDT